MQLNFKDNLDREYSKYVMHDANKEVRLFETTLQGQPESKQRKLPKMDKKNKQNTDSVSEAKDFKKDTETILGVQNQPKVNMLTSSVPKLLLKLNKHVKRIEESHS